MTIIFYNSTNHNDIYGLINKNKRPHGVEYALENTEEAIQNRPRENRRGNTKSTIQRNWQHRIHKTKKKTKKHNTIQTLIT